MRLFEGWPRALCRMAAVDQRPFAITRDGLPFHPVVCGNHGDMVVSLTGGVGARPFHRVGARRNDDHGTNALEIAIRRYIEASNADPKPFVWTKTADDILDSVKLSCQRTSNSHH
jgi:hypothetical protein